MSDITAGQVRVLVVDDQPPNVRLLQAILTPRGYDVLTASSAQPPQDGLRSAQRPIACGSSPR